MLGATPEPWRRLHARKSRPKLDLGSSCIPPTPEPACSLRTNGSPRTLAYCHLEKKLVGQLFEGIVGAGAFLPFLLLQLTLLSRGCLRASDRHGCHPRLLGQCPRSNPSAWAPPLPACSLTSVHKLADPLERAPQRHDTFRICRSQIVSVCWSGNANDALDLLPATPGETLSGLVIIGWYRKSGLCWSVHIVRVTLEHYGLHFAHAAKLWCLLFGLRAEYQAPDGGSCK